jgi:2'-5' RNA ligase
VDDEPQLDVPESAVLVPVPEAERALGHLRRRLDNVGGARVPAHVTVVYPFMPPERIDDAVIEQLRRVVAGVAAFDAVLERVAWFGDGVLYVAPEPAEPFRQLTKAVAAAFPEHQPYGGAYDDPIPHLTVGAETPTEDLRSAVPELRSLLPVRAHVDHALLVQGTGDVQWEVRARLPLG